MFEFIKWLLLVALMAGTAKTSDYLDTLNPESLYSWTAAGIAFIDFFVVMVTGVFVFGMFGSQDFPQGISSTMTIAIIVEFDYLLFVYCKVIPGYTNSGKAIPKTKDTIKIN